MAAIEPEPNPHAEGEVPPGSERHLPQGPVFGPASELDSEIVPVPSGVPGYVLSAAPLTGRTIVVTRSREQASALSLRLAALGARVIEIPTIQILPPRSYAPLDQALRDLASYDWLVVTSANTVRVLEERLGVLGLSSDAQPKTVAVGPSTAAALKQAGFRVDLVPQPAVAESILAALQDRVRGQRVLLIRAEVARDLLPHGLQVAGAEVSIVDAYRTVATNASALIQEVFGARGRGAAAPADTNVKIDALTFTSSSTVRNLAALLREAGASWPQQARVFSIGPVTSATLRECGIEPDGEAAAHDVDGLVAAVLKGLT